MLRYAITDPGAHPSSFSARRAALLGALERWSGDGIHFVQLREKALPAAELYTLCSTLQERLRALGSGLRLLVNSRPDVALAAGVAGVHLTASPMELTPSAVRRLWSERGLGAPILSVSCHTLAEAARARHEGADLILFGPVFEKVRVSAGEVGVSVAAGQGLAPLADAVTAAAPVPVLALGGVTAGNAARCMAAGAAGIAGIRLFQ